MKEKKYHGKVNLQELEEYARTHSAKEIRNEYGNNGLILVYRFGFQHPYKYRTKELKALMIQEEYKNGARQCDLMRKYGLTRQRISQILNK